jgi:hypothetical protein
VRRRHVVDGEHDLDGGGEHLRPGERVLRLVNGASDRGRRGIDLALRQPKLGKPGLRVFTVLAGLPICLFGLHEIPAESVQFTELVVRHPSGGLGRLGEKAARALRFVHRVSPIAVQLHDLGAVDEALSAVGHEVRLGVAPASQRSRPFLRTP